jgi:hypothetical protein
VKLCVENWSAHTVYDYAHRNDAQGTEGRTEAR